MRGRFASFFILTVNKTCYSFFIHTSKVINVVALFCSHAVNLLSNLPPAYLDVLIDVPVQGGLEKYDGKNMDSIQVLLEFLEKRIDKVSMVIIIMIKWIPSVQLILPLMVSLMLESVRVD